MNYPKDKFNALLDTLKLLAAPSRVAILFLLQDSAFAVSDIAGRIKSSQTLTSHHLGDLTELGFLEGEKIGRTVKYSLTQKGQVLLSYLVKIGAL